MDSKVPHESATIPSEEIALPDTGTSGPSWQMIGRCLFIAGLICYVAAQTNFLMSPLWDRSLPPEVDDSFAYLVKTAEMESCFFQDCEALEDLRKQMTFPQSDPDIRWQRSLLMGRIFQVYHPLFSAILLGTSKLLSCDLTTAYKVVWTGSPLFFGLAFAAWAYSLWGMGVAGITLFMLAFTVFPNTGVHYFVPWNCALGVALLLWARILSREGDAPYSLMAGTLILILIHPLGRIYAVIAVLLIVTIFGIPASRRMRLSILAALAIVAAAFLLSAVVHRPVLGFKPEPYSAGQSYVAGVIQSIITVGREIQRWEPVLFRSKIFLFVALVFGFLTVSESLRRRNLRIFLLIMAIQSASFLYVLPRHPADLFIRLWIPALILIFGAVSQGLWFSLQKSVDLLSFRRKNRGRIGPFNPSRDWPMLAFMALAMFAFQVFLLGCEGLVIMSDHMKKRQPLALSSHQARVLLDESEHQDRVLYDSVSLMSFYFVHGALDRGAVFYPAVKGTNMESEWLSRPDLRFVIRYSPLVQTPQLEHEDEEKWWRSFPQLRYSLLHKESGQRVLSVEGRIPLQEFSSITIEPKQSLSSGSLRLLMENPGSRKTLDIIPLYEQQSNRGNDCIPLEIPARWSGWIQVGISRFKGAKGFRISSPAPKGKCSIAGISFGSTSLHWPWAEKCTMKLVPSDGKRSPEVVSFDSARLVPASLRNRGVTVLDDAGSSVLVRLSDEARSP